MICVEADQQGVVHVISPQPADVSTCTAVLASPDELASPFILTIEQGVQISVAIMFVWACAWVFKQIARALSIGDVESEKP